MLLFCAALVFISNSSPYLCFKMLPSFSLMQGALLCTDPEPWSSLVRFRRKVVISFAFVRTATSIQQPASQQQEWYHRSFRQIPENFQVLQALANQLHTVENSSVKWAARAGSKSLGSILKAMSLQKSRVSDTRQMDGDCYFTREISLTIALWEFPAWGCYH